MSIQTIIDNAQFITVDKTKLAAQTLSRSGRIKTAEVASAVPYRFIIGMHSGLKYSTNRGLLEELDRLDKTIEEEVDIGSTNTALGYVTAYQGDLTSGQIGQIVTASVTPFSGANIYLNTNSVTGSPVGNLFKKGDFIQVGPTNGRYPYQVTEDVTYSVSTTLRIPVHRAVIDQSGFSQSARNIAVGSDVQWFVKMVRKPTYTIIPHDRIQFNSDFELIEVIE